MSAFENLANPRPSLTPPQASPAIAEPRYESESIPAAAITPATTNGPATEKQELADRNLLAGLKTAISSLQAGPTRNKAEARWNKKPTIDLTDPLVGALGAALGLTSNQVDEIFSAAANRT